MPEIKGGCLCGAVTYSASGEPVFTGVCHCRTCQKGNGSAFAIVLGVPAPAVTVTGETGTFEGRGDSGQPIYRRFCPKCGSQLIAEAAIMPGMLMITAGTLDDPSWVKPAMEIYCDSKQPWVELAGGMASFAKMPPPPG
jgi:hypothetical protein